MSQHMGTTQIWSIAGNTQRLDGGAMFGNVPKALWARWCKPDSENRIELACRAMLIKESSGRLILFEAGIGIFFPPKLRARFGVMSDEHQLLIGLNNAGFEPDDIDVVVLSHLHFDHAGGLLTEYIEHKPYELVFPNAAYVVSQDAWSRACQPHARDRASFIPELQPLLESTGRLEIVGDKTSQTLGADYRLHFSYGHTPGLMLAEVPSDEGPVLFCGDLIPGVPWVHLPITMGYDRYPEMIIDEKEQILASLLSRNGRLFFTHDPSVAIGRLSQDQKLRYGVTETVNNLSGDVL
ncbi:MAG: MBL fold metallo-hydrolase [Myxococcota bacterium]|nr:MBL fold metallo-hydrolase [Myxococcota bacterium]